MESGVGATVVRARAVIERHQEGRSRRDLQAAGLALDRATDGKWLATAVLEEAPWPSLVVVDSARTRQQVIALRELGAPTFHVSVRASLRQRHERFVVRADAADRGLTFAEATDWEDHTERLLLARTADLAIDTASVGVRAAVASVLDHVASLG
jgi:hypothetical protein